MYWGFVCNDCIFANFENPALFKKRYVLLQQRKMLRLLRAQTR